MFRSLFMSFLPFLVVLCGCLSATEIELTELSKVPVYFEGRYHPLLYMLNHQEKPVELSRLPILPSRYEPAHWVSLDKLRTESINFTAYQQNTFENIRQAYLDFISASSLDKEATTHRLGEVLLNSYAEIASTPYLVSSKRTLRFPSLLQLQAEEIYLRFPWVALCFSTSVLGFLLFLFKQPRGAKVFSGISLFLLSGILLLRIYILERPPVSNMFETLLFVPWLASVVSFFLKREAIPFASLLTSFLLGTVLFAPLKDSFGNVQAVLDSTYWLTIHVLLVVGSYSLFLIGSLFAHAYFAAIILKNPSLSLSLAKLNRQSIYLGVSSLIAGTVLGGIWAAQSWGRFWDWDPKESWAFITICTYLIGIHAYRYRLIDQRGLACCSIIGAWAVTFTWYGVNYILGTGLHSYGFGSGGTEYYLTFILFDIFLFILLIYYSKQIYISY